MSYNVFSSMWENLSSNQEIFLGIHLFKFLILGSGFTDSFTYQSNQPIAKYEDT